MRATHEAPAVRDLALMPRTRLSRELRAAFEFWLLPFALALLPYRLGIAAARLSARWFPLYPELTDAGAAQWHALTGGGDERAWRAEFRFGQLVDHADLFWSLTRSRSFLLKQLGAPAPDCPRDRPLLVLSFHYGQGLWLLHWLAAHGHPPRFVSIRFAREDCDSTLRYAYAKLRIATVARLAVAAPIFTGGARREIAQTLQRQGTVYGLLDVPTSDDPGRAVNAKVLGRDVCLPAGLLESAAEHATAALVLTARVVADGSRRVEAESFALAGSLSVERAGELLTRRIEEAPAAWHFWYLWPTIEAPAGMRR